MTTDLREEHARIAGYDAVRRVIDFADGAIALWQVADLERHIDRAALLSDADVPDPPYWALCWSGARVLAAAVPPRAGRVLELGCGLALPGLMAARRGGSVVCVDRLVAPLQYVQASARANGLSVATVAADMLALPFSQPFDCLLAAEILYERSAFPLLAEAMRRLLAPGGQILMTDARRIDTRAFYPELARVGLTCEVDERRVDEEGWPIDVRLVRITEAQSNP